jgi:hypothetical protein
MNATTLAYKVSVVPLLIRKVCPSERTHSPLVGLPAGRVPTRVRDWAIRCASERGA